MMILGNRLLFFLPSVWIVYNARYEAEERGCEHNGCVVSDPGREERGGVLRVLVEMACLFVES